MVEPDESELSQEDLLLLERVGLVRRRATFHQEGGDVVVYESTAACLSLLGNVVDRGAQ